MDTIDFGKFLILDEMANLAENDTVQYTHKLMNLPHEDYKVWRICSKGWNGAGKSDFFKKRDGVIL